MIDYVEIRNTETELAGIIDTAKSIIWHSAYFGVGDFEIYTQATPEAREILKKYNYVTRPDNPEIGIIEKIDISDSNIDGLMITASGRFAKSILDRRLIYNLSGTSNSATILRGKVETEVRKIVSNNAISCAFDSRRNIPLLELGAISNIPLVIVDDNGNATQKQVSYDNLLEYSDRVLQEYGLSARVILDAERKKLQYVVSVGADRSVNNSDGNDPIIFSSDFDNLVSSAYSIDTTQEKNVALIGGAGEGTARFYSLLAGSEIGLARREVWIDASSISKTYKDDSEDEQTYTDAEYKSFLDEKGKQEMSAMNVVDDFNGVLDVTNGNWIYNRDFFLGDIVTVESSRIGVYMDVRILQVTEVQDENGYTVAVDYQN